MARVMMSSPSVVLLDEPTSSLAPMPSAQLLEQDVPALAAAGVAVILVEQRAVQAIAVSDWVYVLVGGAVELQGQAREIGARGDIGAVFLGANSEPSRRVRRPTAARAGRRYGARRERRRQPGGGTAVTAARAYPRERRLLAQACRVLAMEGLVETTLGHVSLRVSDTHFLVRARRPAEHGLRFTTAGGHRAGRSRRESAPR